MIAQIRGTLLEATPLSAVVDVGGIGYEIHIPVTAAEKLPHTGSEVKLFIVPVYREDSQALYGFTTRDERAFFRLLVEKVSGVGPRLALALMSKLSLPILQQTIAAGDAVMLAKCPGIGKKTAERLIVELRDKMPELLKRSEAPGSSSSTAAVSSEGEKSPIADAVSAMLALGYKLAEADKAVRNAASKAEGKEMTAQELIRAALRG